MSAREPIVGHVGARVRGRFLFAEAEERAAGLLVGFHGYGEIAEDALDALSDIPGSDGWHRAAIQALHSFYKNRTGEVAATWMTRLDRELAIEDNVGYVANALRRLRELSGKTGPLVLTGFSQGTAMVYRAAAMSGQRCHGLIALAGDVPPDLATVDLAGFPRVLIGCGTGDDWYDLEKLAADVELLEGKGVDVRTCVFDGGHEWHPAFREAAAAFLREAR